MKEHKGTFLLIIGLCIIAIASTTSLICKVASEQFDDAVKKEAEKRLHERKDK